MDSQPDSAPKLSPRAESIATEGTRADSPSASRGIGSAELPGSDPSPLAAPQANFEPRAKVPEQRIFRARAASKPARGSSRSAAPRRRTTQSPPKPAARDRHEREAVLKPTRIEPWSVMRISFAVSLIGWLILNIVMAALYWGLASHHVFHAVESVAGALQPGKGRNASSWFSASTILGYTMVAGAIEVFVVTALATIGAVVYNLVTSLTGGIEVTLREAD
jgi:hypothetical protein